MKKHIYQLSNRLVLMVLLIGLLILSAFFIHRHSVEAQTAAGTIVLVLAGDWDDKFPGATQSSLQNAMSANADLIGFVGDLSYDGSDSGQTAGIATAQAWCSKVRGIIGTKPTFFTPGDHDSFLQDGDVTTYDSANCLTRPTASPKVSNFTGNYPWLYYFDVTSGGTTVRVVGAAGDASGDLADAYPSASQYMTGYEKDGNGYNFLAQAFTDAKNKNYWTVFINHEPCIDPGKDNPGEWCYDIVDLMSDTGVDVMTTASSHNAWLTKQMSKGPGCNTITINGKGAINQACAKQVANNAYKEGEGWVNAHAGTGGKDGSSSYDCLTGPDVPYVVPGTCGANESDGALHLTINGTAIQGNFKKNTGDSLYTFSITRANGPTTAPSITSPPISTGPTSAACPQKNVGDADCNNLINLTDFEAWRKEFLNTVTTKSADFDGSGTVLLNDYEIWRKKFTGAI